MARSARWVALDGDAPEPAISGVFDTDRTAWADPASDWTIRVATKKGDERTALFDSYGSLDRSPSATWRARLYEVRHLGRSASNATGWATPTAFETPTRR